MKNNGLMIAMACTTCAGVGGYFLGKGFGPSENLRKEQSITTKSSSHSSSLGNQGSSRERSSQPDMRGYHLSQNPRAGMEVLLEELKQSPIAQMDFEALFGIWDMIRYLDASQLEELMSSLDRIGGGEEIMTARMMILNRWAAQDGPAAMERLLEEESGMMRSIGSMGAMSGWMRSNPEQAYAWFQENGDQFGGRFGMGKEQIEGMYFAGLAKKNFEGTMARISEMDGKTQKTVMSQLALTAAADSERRTQLLSYLKEKGDKKLLDITYDKVVTRMSMEDPKSAIDFVKGEKFASERQRSLINNVTSSWSYSDPQAAVEYMSSDLKGNEGAGNEISNAFGNWIAQDETAASAWLTEQPEEFQSDKVFESAGRNLVNNESFDRAAEWYDQILDEKQRERSLKRLYSRWSGEDQDAADEWKEALPAEDQSYFIEEVKKHEEE